MYIGLLHIKLYQGMLILYSAVYCHLALYNDEEPLDLQCKRVHTTDVDSV